MKTPHPVHPLLHADMYLKQNENLNEAIATAQHQIEDLQQQLEGGVGVHSVNGTSTVAPQ